MPEVSVVIPAFRPRFLDTAISSVLAQTFADFELLVSDDSDGDQVEAVVAKWTDPRIRYTRNPTRQVPGTNRDHLVSLASAPWIKFLCDDDFLFPQSIEVLLKVARARGAGVAYHHRIFVDEAGVPTERPEPLPPGQVVPLTGSSVFDILVRGNPQRVNPFGEPSNILVDAAALRSLPAPFAIGGHRTRFLDDIALFLNMADAGREIVGAGVALSAFRRHQGQMSFAWSPVFSAGLFEWELAYRWAADRGHLSPADLTANLQMMRALYQERVSNGEYPELQGFLALPVGPGQDGRHLSTEFVAALQAAHAVINARLQTTPAAA